MTTGIYKIYFTNTHKVYIGQSLNVENRFKQHLYKLNLGIAAKRLQEAYTIYGTPMFELLEECAPEELSTLEQEIIDVYNSVEDGFNTLAISGRSSKSYQYGDKASRSKFSNENIILVLNLLCSNPELNQQQIADIAEVTKGVVNTISSGHAHKWLRDEYPDKYQFMMSLKGKRTSYAVKGESVVQSKQFPNIKDKEGNIYQVTNLTHFSEEYGLHVPSLSKLLKGAIKHHKGWTLV